MRISHFFWLSFFQVKWQFSTSVTAFQVHLNFSTSARTFKLQRNFPTSAELSNFGRNSPTSVGSFQLRKALSNLNRNFPTTEFIRSKFLNTVLLYLLRSPLVKYGVKWGHQRSSKIELFFKNKKIIVKNVLKSVLRSVIIGFISFQKKNHPTSNFQRGASPP